MVDFAFFRPDDDKHELSFLGNVFYYLTNCIALPISYALIFLSLNVMIQIYNNITTLERFKKRTVRIPCYGPTWEDRTLPNEYDMLWLANMRQVLGPRMWMWPLPLVGDEMKGQGYFYPKIPEITMADMNILLKDTSRVHNTSFTVNDFESDPKEYIKKAVEKYSGNTFVIHPGPEGGQVRQVYIPTEAERK
jgi:hypothetical protein